MSDTDTSAGGWLDAARPGYPLNPERTGPHWLKTDKGDLFVGHWDAVAALWEHDSSWWGAGAVATVWQYAAPCHTPAEVAAQVEAARRKEREACAQVVLRGQTVLLAGIGPVDGYPWDTAAKAAAAIRARGDA